MQLGLYRGSYDRKLALIGDPLLPGNASDVLKQIFKGLRFEFRQLYVDAVRAAQPKIRADDATLVCHIRDTAVL